MQSEENRVVTPKQIVLSVLTEKELRERGIDFIVLGEVKGSPKDLGNFSLGNAATVVRRRASELGANAVIAVNNAWGSYCHGIAVRVENPDVLLSRKGIIWNFLVGVVALATGGVLLNRGGYFEAASAFLAVGGAMAGFSLWQFVKRQQG